MTETPAARATSAIVGHRRRVAVSIGTMCIVTQIVGDHITRQVRGAYAGFAVFGTFWGSWGATVPALRDQARLSDGQLGTALLFVGAGALPAMLLAGRAVDRWGRRVTAVLLVLLGGAGVAVAVTARDVVSMSLGLAVLGASSGAADVAINASAGAAERASGRPVVTRAHGVFSSAVVLASLGTGLLRGAGAPLVAPFLLVVVAAALAALAVIAAAPAGPGTLQPARRAEAPEARRAVTLHMLPLMVVGGLAALAFAVENAHQSWSAVYLVDVLSAPPAIAAGGPAVFAAVVAVTRFAVSAIRPARATGVLLAGAATAAAGTAVLFPTLLSVATARVEEPVRGVATSMVTTVAYTGFLAGPVYVGGWAGAVGLPGAMLAVAGLAAALALLAWPTLRAGVTTREEQQWSNQVDTRHSSDSTRWSGNGGWRRGRPTGRRGRARRGSASSGCGDGRS
jgi:MFS family permease